MEGTVKDEILITVMAGTVTGKEFTTADPNTASTIQITEFCDCNLWRQRW